MGDAKLKAAVVSAEIALRERERALGRVRARVMHAASECAALAGSVGGVVADVAVVEEHLKVRGVFMTFIL